MINDHKTRKEWKIQLSMEINFVCSKDSEKLKLVLCTQKCNNRDIFIVNETNDIIEELFKSLLQKYQEGLKESMRGSKFIL